MKSQEKAVRSSLTSNKFTVGRGFGTDDSKKAERYMTNKNKVAFVCTTGKEIPLVYASHQAWFKVVVFFLFLFFNLQKV